jgi:hypothetical protein
MRADAIRIARYRGSVALAYALRGKRAKGKIEPRRRPRGAPAAPVIIRPLSGGAGLLTRAKGRLSEPLFHPLYSTMSKITILESGSKSGGGASSFFTNSACLSAPPTLLRNGSALL